MVKNKRKIHVYVVSCKYICMLDPIYIYIYKYITAVGTTPRTETKANAVEQGRWDKPENQDKRVYVV